ncbi:MAG TPA: tetratricopeptide repeat protein [Pyrinomonadaceae bacterium]|nr:tetratricopeptide repeat protein [Pyrinomonadaceae bacterium]
MKYFLQIAFVLVFSFAAANAQPTDQERASALWKQGVTNFEARRYDAAISNFNEYLKIRPDAAAGWFNRGISYYERAANAPLESDYRQAVADLTQAIKLDAKKADQWYMRGRARQKLIVVDFKISSAAAIADYTQAIALDPKNSGAFGGRGEVYYEIGQYDKATNDLNKAILLDPKNAAAYYYRGKIRGYNKRYVLARADVEKAISLYPNYEVAKIYLEYINAEAKKSQPTIAGKPAVSTKPPVVTKPTETPITDAREGFKRADDAERAGDHRKVIDVVSKTLPLIPMKSKGLTVQELDTFVYLDLIRKQARAYLALKQYKEADEAFRTVALDGMANMNAFNAKANAEMKRDTSGSGGGAIMASVQTGQSTIICRSTFEAIEQWNDSIARDRVNDINVLLASGYVMGAVRQICATSFHMDGMFEHARIYSYFGTENKTTKLNAAIERYTEAIKYLQVFRPAYESRAKAYRELGRIDLALADEKKAATLPAK